MKSISNAMFVLGSLILTTACGNMNLKESDSLRTEHHSDFDAESAYLNMPAPDYTLSFTPAPIGGSTTQRQTATRFCRKSAAIVMNPAPTYACWEKSSTGSAAQASYQIVSAYLNYGISIGMIGSGTTEAISADETIICQKVTTMSFPASTSYTCYSRL